MPVVQSINARAKTFVLATKGYADEHSQDYLIFKQPRLKTVRASIEACEVSMITWDTQSGTVPLCGFQGLRPGLSVVVIAQIRTTGVGRPVNADRVRIYQGVDMWDLIRKNTNALSVTVPSTPQRAPGDADAVGTTLPQNVSRHPTDLSMADVGLTKKYYSRDCPFQPSKLPFKLNYSVRANAIDKVWTFVQNDSDLDLNKQRIMKPDGVTVDVAATLRNINNILFEGVENIERSSDLLSADRSDRQLLRAEAQIAYVERVMKYDSSVNNDSTRGSSYELDKVLREPFGVCAEFCVFERALQRDSGHISGVTQGMTADYIHGTVQGWKGEDFGGLHAWLITKFINDEGKSAWLPASSTGGFRLNATGKSDWIRVYPTNDVSCELFNAQAIPIPSLGPDLGDMQNVHFFSDGAKAAFMSGYDVRGKRYTSGAATGIGLYRAYNKFRAPVKADGSFEPEFNDLFPIAARFNQNLGSEYKREKDAQREVNN